MAVKSVEEVKQLWETWDIQVLIVTSLFIQAWLTFLAPLRKRSANGFLVISLWVLYLSASAVALYVISQISGRPTGDTNSEDLYAFWAPFLLLHLGGPDTITALALEDNELWHRHALELTTQLAVTVYVFVLSLRNRQTHLWVPTFLMFVDGLIKYSERTQALYHASIENFRDSLDTEPEAGPNYERLMGEFHSAKCASIPTWLQRKDESPENNSTHNDSNSGAPGRSCVSGDDSNSNSCEDKLIQEAYEYYELFKGLLADSYLSLKDRKISQEAFLEKSARDAFRIIEIELNLMYDVFYTKSFLMQHPQAFLRVFSFLSVIASFVVFAFEDKNKYDHINVVITYILLCGAIALDISAFVMFVLSDWWIIIKSWHGRRHKYLLGFFSVMLELSRKVKRAQGARWSQTISRYNLLDRCFRDPPSVINWLYIRRIKDAVIGWVYVSNVDIKKEMMFEFIAKELKQKAEYARGDDLKTIKEVCSARGNLLLQDEYDLVSDFLQPWTIDVEYDESVLTWHLATDILYLTTNHHEAGGAELRELSKQLSDYMVSLLLRKQQLMSSVVGMSDKRFRDTCAEARKFYRLKFKGTEFVKKFCEKLLQVNVEVRPTVAKGDKSKSVLFEACRLAKQLQLFGKEERWEIMSKVWVELMCYAAVRCAPRSHLAQLSKGGELITLVWLLMAHFGLGERFLQNQEFGWTKLIIPK